MQSLYNISYAFSVLSFFFVILCFTFEDFWRPQGKHYTIKFLNLIKKNYYSLYAYNLNIAPSHRHHIKSIIFFSMVLLSLSASRSLEA